MTLQEQFEDAAKRVNNLSSRPSNDILLKLYAFYKQGSEGDVTGDRPGGFDFKAIAKYNAWESLKGKSSEEAMEEYVALVAKLEQEA